MHVNIRSSNAWKTTVIIMSLAWPTIIEQAMQTAVQYIDTAMVGALGTQATAAVGATTTVGWLIISTFSALGVGFLSKIAHACGANDSQTARRVSAQTLLIALYAGILFTVLCSAISGILPVWMQVDPSIQKLAGTYFFIIYLPMLPRAASMLFGTVLRAAGDTKTPMKVGIFVNLINIGLNFLLIYETRVVSVFGIPFTMPGAGLGVVGAAIASAVAFTWGGIHTTYVLWKHPMVSPKGQRLKLDGSILKPCFKTAFPNILQRIG